MERSIYENIKILYETLKECIKACNEKELNVPDTAKYSDLSSYIDKFGE